MRKLSFAFVFLAIFSGSAFAQEAKERLLRLSFGTDTVTLRDSPDTPQGGLIFNFSLGKGDKLYRFINFDIGGPLNLIGFGAKAELGSLRFLKIGPGILMNRNKIYEAITRDDGSAGVRMESIDWILVPYMSVTLLMPDDKGEGVFFNYRYGKVAWGHNSNGGSSLFNKYESLTLGASFRF